MSDDSDYHLLSMKDGMDHTHSMSVDDHPSMIGPLTHSERLEKVLRYLHKKLTKSSMKKFCYKCRKQVAEKRLRIKGRFVTRQQAFEILGITYDELKSNEIIQKLLESHAGMLDTAGFLNSDGSQMMNHGGGNPMMF
jgi:hypothetical protein